jgi:hypothetical protein
LPPDFKDSGAACHREVPGRRERLDNSWLLLSHFAKSLQRLWH